MSTPGVDLTAPLPRHLQGVEVGALIWSSGRIPGRRVAAGDPGPIALLLGTARQARDDKSDHHSRAANQRVGVHLRVMCNVMGHLCSLSARAGIAEGCSAASNLSTQPVRQVHAAEAVMYKRGHNARPPTMPRNGARARHVAPVPPSPGAPPVAARRRSACPGLTLALLTLSPLPRIADSRRWPRVLGAGGVCWSGWRYWRCGSPRGVAGFISAPPRPQHYIQMCCHLSVYGYWGYYWAPVYPYRAAARRRSSSSPTPSTCCSSWSRAPAYALGFGPFPIVFSTNLFLWFKDDWFAFQFLLIAVGFLGKAFVRWERDGRRVHIFNPSAFTLALFSLVLIVTGTTELTWGAGDRHHLQPRTGIYTGPVPHRAGRHVLLLDHAGDGLGRGDALRPERALQRGRPACRISSTPRFRRRCSLDCTCW